MIVLSMSRSETPYIAEKDIGIVERTCSRKHILFHPIY